MKTSSPNVKRARRRAARSPEARPRNCRPPHRRANAGHNLTDAESCIVPSLSGGFEQDYNVQAGVDFETYLIVAQYFTQRTNDKQEIESVLATMSYLLDALGEAENLLSDMGYFNEANVAKCNHANIALLIPETRKNHNLSLRERFREDSEPPQNPTSVQVMRPRLQTREGKALHGTRNATVETPMA